MKVTFYSNYLTHHQIPFCNALDRRDGVEFYFVSTEPMEEERKLGGWEFKSDYQYELKAYASAENKKKALELARTSDVIIIGSAPEEYVKYRMTKGEKKLTFRYSERIYKKGRWRVLSPRGLVLRYKSYYRYINKPIYMLCASAYTKGDFALSCLYLGRCYKWGYFPETKKYEDIEKVIENKKPNSILWTARLIDWKHPEIPIEIAKRLKEDGYGFTLDMIGVGPLENKVKTLISKYGLEDKVRLLGSMSPDKVREKMEESEVFLFTSDRNEGWGAVLNESMNSCCAVIANKAIGSVPYLIKDGENGLTYSGEKIDRIYEQVNRLLDDKELRKQLGKKAYETIVTEWNAEVAAERFIKLVESGKYKRNEMFRSGPCSRA